MADENQVVILPDPSAEPEVSPTGLPMIPAKFVPYLMVLTGVNGVILGLPELGVTLPGKLLIAAKVIGASCVYLTTLTPGLRRKPL